MQETPKERHNRELIELLNELRVARVIYGNKLAIAGFLFLAVAMVSALLTVTTFLFGAAAGVVAALWYGIALGRRSKPRSRTTRRAR